MLCNFSLAAIRHVTTGTYLDWIKGEAEKQVAAEDEAVKATLNFMTQQYIDAVEAVTGVNDPKFLDFMARRLVEMAGYIVMGYLMLDDTQRDSSFRKSLHVFVNYGKAEVAPASSSAAPCFSASPLIQSRYVPVVTWRIAATT